MNISLNWLSDFLPGPALDPDAAADVLMRGGFPVEHVEPRGADTMLDVEVTSNRSDCLSHVGVARELAALMGRELRAGSTTLHEKGRPVTEAASVRIDAAALCPHYTARVIRGVKIGPSPKWMVDRLEAIGLRSINNVVDVTNYVMFELGQPLHAFDFDKIGGQQIIVREAMLGEKLTSIDGHERRLTPGMLVIADAKRPVALAGVMGGLDSEVSAGTINVLLESARFDALSVRRTARALAMKSDSSYRFERGIDPTLPDRASRRAAELILQTAGGELMSGVAEAGAADFEPKHLAVRLGRMKKVLGVEIPAAEAADALARLQLSPEVMDGAIRVTVPSWRLDLGIEIDLIEEVARVVGYDRIPVRDTISIVVTPPSPEARSMELIRRALVGAGYFEAVTFTFAADALAGDFLPPEYVSLPRADASVRKADAQLRPSLLPGLLEAVRRNESNGTSGAKLFENGSAFGVDSAGVIHETRKLSLVGDGDLRAVRGVVDAVLGKLDAERAVRVTPLDRPGYAAGAAGRIDWGGSAVGFIGRVDPKVADKLSLRLAPAAAELDLQALVEGTQHVPQLQPLPRFPAVQRDLSLIVAESTRYDAIDRLVRELKLPDLEDINYVTTYRGKQVEQGRKSVTIALMFRSPSTTLTSEQVEAQVQRVVQAAADQLGAKLRA